ncbi:MAG: hypothetical protein ABJO02_00235 [Reichenbachiella sp.]|uniref:hypothetical protein n=1 Tax=Reichenbachiella sp. TaxID=2184521 RepID=UPI00329A77C6
MSTELSKLESAVVNLSSEDIMQVFNLISDLGDILILKSDGVREEKPFTIVISSSDNSFESLRSDTNDVVQTLKLLLEKYIELKKK